MSAPIVVAAVLPPSEAAAAATATARVAALLAEAMPGTPPVALRPVADLEQAAAVAPDALLLSLGPARPEVPWDAAAAALAATVAAAARIEGCRPVLLTLFRHVPPGPHQAALRERIRRLNRLAIELSRETGAAVADIDRACAQPGARALGADHRLEGAAVREVAAEAIAAALLAEALDARCEERVLQKARRLLGQPGARAAAAP